MANLTSEQAMQLSDNFYYLGMAIGDFRYENWDRLSLDDNKELSDTQNMLLQQGEDILAYSTTLIMDEVSESLAKINEIATDISGTIKTLHNIQKGLNIAAALLILGVAITNRDTQGIGNSIKDVVNTWKNPLA
ncbi:hypothetical protein [Algoriphagus chordae]|uniref:Uncharacterized protein n=1 Tax=Algoriphagus chordae TaxID=237019 RepID=A0A2W7QZT0_9BACT|nr:hypothetical protein [Algoriphagus chordae]PZX54053.1 hypothetical protein LV85_01392 [Algoriphagus chordae]